MLDLFIIIPAKLYKNFLEVLRINYLQQQIELLQQKIKFTYVQYIFSVRILFAMNNIGAASIIRNDNLCLNG